MHERGELLLRYRRRDGHEQHRVRACACACTASRSCVRRSATATFWKQCARAATRSAASNPGTSLDFRYNNTGDGPRTAMTLLGIVAARQTRLCDLVNEVQIAPQILVNVTSRDRGVLALDSVRAEIAQAQAALGGTGRLLIRPSGTEPLIRVMAEGEEFGAYRGDRRSRRGSNRAGGQPPALDVYAVFGKEKSGKGEAV